MNRIFTIICFFILVLPAGVAMAAPMGQTQLNPAYVMVGSVGDGGWSYALNQGRLLADAQFPQVQSIVAESIMEDGEVSFVMERLIKQLNAKLIFATSYGYSQYVLATAAKYPDVKFVHVTGLQRAENVSTYFGRMYQARYLSGLVAGKMSESGKIGYVAAFPIPEVVRGINAFTLGVREVNPNATVQVVWLYSWYDQAKERELAQKLIDLGCDLLTLHADTGEVARTCEKASVYVIGYNADMSLYAPRMHLAAPVFNWGKMFAHAYLQVLEDNWRSENLWWGLKEGAVTLSPYGAAVGNDVRQLVEGRRQLIIAGQFDVFDGPLKDNQGRERVADKQSMTDQQMLEFNWFVEGVEGHL